MGLSRGCYDGLPEVLEINGNSELLVLTANPLYQNKNKVYLAPDSKEGLGLLLPDYEPKQVEVKA